MHLSLFKRRTGWWPTPLGWLALASLILGPPVLWWFEGERFLSVTHRLPADVLVIEGWVGVEALKAAVLEFEQGRYQYVVTTGGLTSEHWRQSRWSYAEMAKHELLQAGIPAERIILAPAKDVERGRTYESAVSTWKALAERGIHPKQINLLTLGPHALRSRLTFSRAANSESEVGTIAWVPSEYQGQHWWQSSERARDLITETVAYLFELIFRSGRHARQ